MHGDCDKRISTPRVGGSNPSGRAKFYAYISHLRLPALSGKNLSYQL